MSSLTHAALFAVEAIGVGLIATSAVLTPPALRRRRRTRVTSFDAHTDQALDAVRPRPADIVPGHDELRALRTRKDRV